jgi:hypothetical protein
MKIRTGFEISYESVQPTPMLLVLSVHPSRFDDLLTPQLISFDPPTPPGTTATASVTSARALSSHRGS